MKDNVFTRIRTAWGVWRRSRNLPNQDGRYGTELSWWTYLFSQEVRWDKIKKVERPLR
jgi:hypothetical protein